MKTFAVSPQCTRVTDKPTRYTNTQRMADDGNWTQRSVCFEFRIYCNWFL